MRKLILALLCFTSLSVLANTPPQITNVRASQRTDTKLVDIYYDAADADGDLLKVRIEISDNDGARYSVPAFSLTGDIGEGVAPGNGKHIVWDAGTDWDGEYSDKMRVKVFAIDAKGFPGMEWGDEVPPGGFLLGQDGGAEGSGPSRHVNIPWSYWMGKYEVTCQQYCDFLNAALSIGYIKCVKTEKVLATSVMPLSYACREDVLLCSIGDTKPIRWNVNKFECSSNERKDQPANVTWNGAIAFARFYGYDLPTDAEWEKAARGAKYEDAGEHLCFPWGDEISAAYANTTPETNIMPVGYYNGNQIPVGPDTVNGYGLYDVIGNAPEWTLTCESEIEEYPQEESLISTIHNPFRCTLREESVSSYNVNTIIDGADRIIRGLEGNMLCWRKLSQPSTETPLIFDKYLYVGSTYNPSKVPSYISYNAPMGFRVIRRQNEQSLDVKVVPKEDFEDWQGESSYNVAITNQVNGGEWILSGGASVVGSGVNNKCILLSNNSDSRLYFTKVKERIAFVRFNAKAQSAGTPWYVYLGAKNADGSIVCNSMSVRDQETYMVHSLSMPVPMDGAAEYFMYVSNGSVYVDDVEFIVISE